MTTTLTVSYIRIKESQRNIKIVFMKKSFNATHTYVDLFIRFFLLNDGYWVGRACAPQYIIIFYADHDDSQYMVPEAGLSLRFQVAG